MALKNYKIAVQIEDSFREQFKKMYPGKKVVSRLNEDKYFFATQRIKDLNKPLLNNPGYNYPETFVIISSGILKLAYAF